MQQGKQAGQPNRKSASRTARRVKLGLAAVAAVVFSQKAHAADTTLYWDTNGATAGFGSATATWGTSTDWTTDSTGSSTPTVLTTTNTNDLIISPTGNQIFNVSGAVVADRFQIATSTATGLYTEAISGGTSITLGGGASTPGITVDSYNTVTISTPLIFNSASTTVQFSNGYYGLPIISGGITGTGNLYLTNTDSHYGFEITTGAVNMVGSIQSTTTNTNAASGGNYIYAAIGSNVTGVTSTQGTLFLQGTNTYTGTTSIASGAVIQLNAANIMPNGSTAGFVSDSGLFNLSGHSQTINGLTGAGIVDSAGTATLSIGANNSTSAFTGVLQNSTGSFTLSKIGSGTLLLSGTDTYSGGTYISGGGVLAAGSAKALGASSTLTFGTTYGQGNEGTIQLNVAPTNTYAISFGTNYGNSGTIQANYSSPAITFGALTLSQNNTLNLTAGGGSTGATPTMTFAGSGNTFGAANNTTASYLNAVGVNASIGSMTPVALNAGVGPETQTLTLEGSSFGDSLGAVANGPGTSPNFSTGAITKTGSGTWTLTGANTYTGPTNINAGTLALDHTAGTGALGNTAVTIAGGATLLVKGTTTIANTGPTMNVAGGTSTATQGTLSLSDGTINTLNISGNLSFGTGSNGAILGLDLGSVSGSSDELNVTGSVVANGLTTINLMGATLAPGTYNLIQTGVASFTSGNVNASTGFAMGSHPSGFYSFTLSDVSTTLLQLSVTGSSNPNVAYWTGAASQTGGDTANNWGYGSSLSTTQSNWSSDQAGAIDTLQVPGANSAVYFTANNAVPNSSNGLATQLDGNYSLMSLSFDTSQATNTISSVIINTNGHTLTLGTGGLTVTGTDNSNTLITGTGTGVLINGNQSWENNNNNVTLNISTGIAGTAVGSGSVYTLSLNGSGTGGVYLSGPITDGTAGGSLALYLAQSGITALAGTNTFSGGAFLTSGTLDLVSSLALEGSTLNMSGGTLSFDASVASNAFTLGGLSGTGNIALQNTASSPVILTVGVNNASTSYGGALSGPGSLVKAGTGLLSLSGSNTYAGTTNISGGTLQLGSGGSIPSTTTLGFTGTGTFDLNGQSQSVASVVVIPGANGTILNGALVTSTITYTASAASTSILATGTGGSISSAGPITINASAAGGSSVVASLVEYMGAQLNTSSGIVINAFGNTSDNGGGNSALFIMSNINEAFTGGVNISTGLVDVAYGDGIFNNATNNSTNAISIAANAGLIAPTSVALNSSSFVLAGASNHYIRTYGSAVLTLNGSISGTNASSGLYFVDGGGTILAGSNSYLGPTTVADGTVKVAGNETAATGGWVIGANYLYSGQVQFNAGSGILITGPIQVGTLSPSGTLVSTLTSDTTVNSTGAITIGRNGNLNISGGSTWNQSGSVTIADPSGSGYGAGPLTVGSGSTFNYNGSAPVAVNPSNNGGYSYLTVAGGTFNTSQPIATTYASSTGLALITLSGGGSIVLANNIPSLTSTVSTPVNIYLGNNSGGLINTNGFNTSIGSFVTNLASNAGVLTKTGLGSLTLSGANNYSGGTVVLAGTLLAGASSTSSTVGPFGSGAIQVGEDTNASLLTNGPYTISNKIFTGAISGGLSIVGGNTDNNSTFSGLISNEGPATITQVANTGTNALNITGGIAAANTGVITTTFAGPGNINVTTTGIANYIGTNYGGTTAVSVTGGNVTFSVANNYSGGTNVSGGILTFAAPGALPNFTSLTIGTGALAQAQLNTGTKNSLFANGLSIAGSVGDWTGKLDLANNDLVVRGGMLFTVTNQVAQGYNGGAWNNNTGGIVSSAAATDSTHLTALGVVQNINPITSAGPLTSTFDGQTVGTNDVLVKYTYYGDANLDGLVDGSDYSLVDNTYQNENFSNGVATNPISGWVNGDFNYDNVVDGSDYTLMDNAFNTQGTQISAQIASPTALVSGASAVPEPTTLALLGIGAVGLLGRRKSRRNPGAKSGGH